MPPHESDFTELRSGNPLAAILTPLLGNAKKIGNGAKAAGSKGLGDIEGALGGFMDDLQGSGGFLGAIMNFIMKIFSNYLKPILGMLGGAAAQTSAAGTAHGALAASAPPSRQTGPSKAPAAGEDLRANLIQTGLTHTLDLLPAEVQAMIPADLKQSFVALGTQEVSKAMGNTPASQQSADFKNNAIQSGLAHAFDLLPAEVNAMIPNELKQQVVSLGTQEVSRVFAGSGARTAPKQHIG